MRSSALVAVVLLSPLGTANAQDASRLEFPCQVFSAQRVELASPVIGVLGAVMVERGSRVTAGQPVAQLRAEVEQAQLTLAQARATAEAQLRSRRSRLALAERTLARNRGLVNERLISAQDLDQVQTDREIAAQEAAAAAESLAIARAEMEAARVALEIRTLRSPIDGIVTERTLQAGEQVRDRPVMIIENVDRLHVEVSLPASFIGRVRAGARGRLSFPGMGLPPVTAPISLIDVVVDPRSDMFGVRFVLDNRDLGIPSGLKCRADLEFTP